MTQPTSVPSVQIGVKSIAVLELLRKGIPRNRLDIDMLLGKDTSHTIPHLISLRYIQKGSYRASRGCYEITLGRAALGEALSLTKPSCVPVINATMRDTYNPAIHSGSRIGIART